MTIHTVKLHFADGERRIAADENETILAAAHRQGVELVAKCRLGLCGTCKAVKMSGDVTVDEEEPTGLTFRDLRNNAILCCQSQARSDLELKFRYRLSAING